MSNFHNNNDKSTLSSARSESSSARSETSKKTSFSDDEIERSVYLPNVANMKGINNLEPKNETQTSFEYLKNNTDEFFLSYPDIFDLDLKKKFNYIASEEDKFFYRLKRVLVFCISMMICINFGLICLTI